MPRSLSLVAASVWLLQLGACAQEAPVRAPCLIEVFPADEVSHAPIQSAKPGDPRQEPGPEAPVQLVIQGRGWPAAHRQLLARYAHARPLAVQHGSASYYAEKFAGRKTASGALYEPRGFTAAHRSLPFGTILRVTRVDSNEVVYVRVTDRGPFGPRGRILDLSRAAAEQLSMLRAGVVKVKAEVMEYGPPRKKRKRRK